MVREQKPTKPSNWLYTENADGSRNFSQFVVLGKEAKEWQECTEAEKEEWEEVYAGKVQEAEVIERQTDVKMG